MYLYKNNINTYWNNIFIMMSSDVEKNVANLNELVNLNENDFVDQLQKIPSFFSKQNEFVLLEQIMPKLLDIFNMKSMETYEEHMKNNAKHQGNNKKTLKINEIN